MSLHGERWLIGGILGSLGMQGRYILHTENVGETLTGLTGKYMRGSLLQGNQSLVDNRDRLHRQKNNIHFD